jgi:hypothetical protein
MSLETLLGPTREDDLKEQSQTELDKYFTNLKENIKDYPDEKLNQMIQQGDYLATMAMRFRNDMRRPQQPMGEQPPVAQQIIGENRQLAGIGTGGMPNAEAISPMAAEGVGALPDQMAPFARDNTGILGAEAPMTMTAAEGGLIELAGGGEVIPFQNRGLVPDFRPRSYSQPFGYFARDPYFIGRNISTDPTMALDPNSSYRGALEGLSLDEQLEFLRRQEEANMGLGGSIVNYPQRSTGPLIDDKERVGRDITGFDYRTDRVANIKAQLAQPGISDTEKERLQKELFSVDRPLPKLENYQTVTPENITDPFLSESNIGKNIEASPATNTGIMLTRPSDARKVEAGSIRERADQGNLGLGALMTEGSQLLEGASKFGKTVSSDIGDKVDFVKGLPQFYKEGFDKGTLGTFEGAYRSVADATNTALDWGIRKGMGITGTLDQDKMVADAQVTNAREFVTDVGQPAALIAASWPRASVKYGTQMINWARKKKLGTFPQLKNILKIGAVAEFTGARKTIQDNVSAYFDKTNKEKIIKETSDSIIEAGEVTDKNSQTKIREDVSNNINKASKEAEKEIKQEIKDVDKIDKKEKKSAMNVIRQRFKTAISEPEFNDFLIATGLTYASGGELAEAAAKQWPNYIKQKQEREKLQAAKDIASGKIKLGERKLDITSKYHKDLIAIKALENRVSEKDIVKALSDNSAQINFDINTQLEELIANNSSIFSTYELTPADIERVETNVINSALRRYGIGGLGTSPPERSEKELAEIEFLKNIARPTG